MPVHDPGRAAPAWLTAGDTHDEVLGLLKPARKPRSSSSSGARSTGAPALLAHKRHRPMKVTKGDLEAEGFSRARTFTTDAATRSDGLPLSPDRRAVLRRSTHGRRVVAERWARDEYDSMAAAHAAGVTVPYPVEFTGDGTLMQFVGDDGVAAPRLVAARLTPPSWRPPTPRSSTTCPRSTRAGLVHADLSPYNLLWWRERVWLIDFPQAVDLVLNPHGFDLLHRDVANVCGWFARRGVACDPEATFAALLAEAW